ncbi:alpha-ribazole phosphatase family protein [Cognaticolwellia mytili]|uniref:alpha-ribazole phosphatase family protein n=1 Tax=Cognaticolwellia mytili TaxID=1888913 RepID=UPI00117C2D78|nr:alpha-ribazole phosphatase family protein [Cognaticolwellia mytili]
MSEFNVYLLRHGELMQKGILCGRTDIELCDVGKQQLTNATNKLANISQCFSSPLIRCREFAEQFCQKNGLTLQVSEQLREMNFGDWDGKSYQTLWKTQISPDEKIPSLGAFWQNPWQCSPPNGESMASFIGRVDGFWLRLLSQLSQAHIEKNDAQNTLVFSHGGVIRYLLAKVLELPIPGTTHMTHLDVPYGGLIHIQIFIDDDGKAWQKLML